MALRNLRVISGSPQGSRRLLTQTQLVLQPDADSPGKCEKFSLNHPHTPPAFRVDFRMQAVLIRAKGQMRPTSEQEILVPADVDLIWTDRM